MNETIQGILSSIVDFINYQPPARPADRAQVQRIRQKAAGTYEDPNTQEKRLARLANLPPEQLAALDAADAQMDALDAADDQRILADQAAARAAAAQPKPPAPAAPAAPAPPAPPAPAANKRAPIVTAEPVYVREEAAEPEGGLLSLLGSGLSAAGSGIMEYLSDPINRKQLAIGLQGLSLNPDRGYQQALMNDIENIRQERLVASTGNATADALERMGRTREAAMVRANPAIAADVYNAVLTAELKGAEPSKYVETFEKGQADADVAMVTAAQQAADSLPKIDETLALIDKADTGLFSETGNAMRRIAAELTDTLGAEKTAEELRAAVADREKLQAILGSEVFAQIRALGIGARGLDTPAEREFLIRVMTGDATMTKEALRSMTMRRRDQAVQNIESYNQRLERPDSLFQQYVDARDLKPIRFDASPPARPSDFQIVTPAAPSGDDYTIMR